MSDDRVEAWFEERDRWRNELFLLREIVKDLPLEETFKWRQPCYTYGGQNVLMVNLLKRAAIVSFFKGALLEDPTGELESPGENSRHVRYLSFRSLGEVEEKREILMSFVQQAIKLSRSGAKVEAPSAEIEYCEELEQALKADATFRSAFEALTPGRRRAYHLHFSGAKQAQTRSDRIERYRSRIVEGKGLHDCVCGLSQRMPNCDGSHKKLSQ